MATLKTLSYIQEMPQKFLEVSEPSSQEGSDLPRNPPINQILKEIGAFCSSNFFLCYFSLAKNATV